MIKTAVIGGEYADVKLYGFNAVGKVDLKSELSGESGILVKLALGSDEKVSLYGMEFFLGERARTEVVAFHGGLLADVADCNMHIGGEESSLKVYSFQGVKIGLLVDDDIDSEILWGRICPICDGLVSIVRTLDTERKERIEKLQSIFSLPVIVRHENDLFALGAEIPEVIVP